MDGSYLYNKVLELVDYCGDIRNGRKDYSKNFSPNNIRRLYISPDGAVVMYHVNAGCGLTRMVSFNNDIMTQCQMCEDYVPMLYVLSADRICASVEDVIICQVGKNGAYIDGRESDFGSLIRSYKGKVGSDLKGTIMNRYKRLNSFVIYDGILHDFLVQTEKFGGGLNVITDSNFVTQNCIVEEFHKDDWYKSYGSSAGFYALDAKGSPLNDHFVKVIERFNAKAKSDEMEKFKQKRVEGVKGEFEKSYEKSLQIIRGYTKIRTLERDIGSSVLGGKIPKVRFLELYEVDGLGKKPSLVKFVGKKNDSKDAYVENKKICETYSMTFYCELVGALLEALVALQSKYPTMVSVMLDEMDGAIKIPPKYEGLNSQLSKPFSGSKWVDSVANLFLFLNAVSVVDNGYDSKQKWLECIEKGANHV